jgi:hypothetical protein
MPHGLSGLVVEAGDVRDVAPGECSMPVSARTCVAGNGGVRSSGFKPKGRCSIRWSQVRRRPDG